VNVSLNHEAGADGESFCDGLPISFRSGGMVMSFLQEFPEQSCKLILTSQTSLYVGDFGERGLKWIATCKRKALQGLRGESRRTAPFNQVTGKPGQTILVKGSLKIEA